MLPGRESVQYVIVDGSFVEDTPSPGDIDVVVVVKELVDGSGGEQIAQWIAQRHTTLKLKLGCDCFPSDETHAEDYWWGFFGRARNGRAKGVLRLEELPA
jgi:hypothetical protein